MNQSVITVTLNPALDKTVNVEQFTFGQLNRIKAVRTDAGGKGINVAKVLNQFSVDVTAWGLCAGDTGSVLKGKLQGLNIPSYFIDLEGETRTNLKIVDEYTRQTTELNEPGIYASQATLDGFTERFLKEVPDSAFVVLGGSLPPGAPADYYKTLIEQAKSKEIRFILDADGEALVHGIKAKPYALKPNIHELEAYMGASIQTDEEIVSAARDLISQGVSYVQVSLGGEGSIIVDSREAYRAKPFPITPLSTVGAGDSMVAAMVYGLINSMSLENIARWSSAAGTITASKPGTQVCTLDEVKQSIDRVHLNAITECQKDEEESS